MTEAQKTLHRKINAAAALMTQVLHEYPAAYPTATKECTACRCHGGAGWLAFVDIGQVLRLFDDIRMRLEKK